MCRPVTIIFFWLLLLPLPVVMLFFSTSLRGVLVFDSVSRLRLARLARHPSISHIIFHTHNFVTDHLSNFTHRFVTHHLSHTILSPAIFHTMICHTPSFTLRFVTHHLSHTTLSHTTLSPTIFHTQLCHTTLSRTIFHAPLCHPPSFTHNFVTHHLSHTTLSSTIFHTQLCHTPSFTHTHTHHFVTHHLSYATLPHTPSFTHNFVTHHLLVTSTFVLCGSRGTCGTGLALVARLGALWSPVTPRYFRVAGVALGAIHLAGVALGDIYLRFAWQAWCLRHWAGSVTC